MTREEIIKALERLNDKLTVIGKTGELCVFGGSAMMLLFNARKTTKDVDAIFSPTQEIRKLAEEVGMEFQLPKAWLNDGIKGFLSDNHQTGSAGMPQYSNLRITAPTPEYLLAMKCMASRIGIGERDEEDIGFLLGKMKIDSVEKALSIVSEFFPPERVPVKCQYLLAEILQKT
ncbi:MAG: DUF6036 family nucleotidyltransferase [Verrucomicrobiae bacterium]|nr:DUF6036 family nucleotidyltransferase [Verrucomicrobiae bacterium]